MTIQNEIAAAQRRGARITAMNAGKPIPYPETAVEDQRPGNVDDAAVLALIRGRNKTVGADIFPPAKLLAHGTPMVPHGHIAFAANEAQEMLAVGPKINCGCMAGIYYPL